MYCNSPKVKCNGKNSKGKQRYLCLSCGRAFLWKSKKSLEQKRFLWFKQWITEGYSVREIAQMYRASHSTVRRVITYWLKQTPGDCKIDYLEIKHLILDGTFLNRPRGLYVALNSESHQVIDSAVNIRESAKDLLVFYTKLAELGIRPESATTDGNTQQIKYLRMIWPEIIHQRCIVHVQRQGLSWCRRNPKRTDAKHLRELFLKLTEVKTKQQSQRFIKAVYAWERRFGTGIESSPNRGKVFSDVIRARSMLLKALPNLFHYIDNSKIARTTNALEGYFSRVKELYRLHRGLSKNHKINYFNWYFFLKPK